MRRIAEVFKHVESFDGLDGLSWLAEARCMHIVSRYARRIKAVLIMDSHLDIRNHLLGLQAPV